MGRLAAAIVVVLALVLWIGRSLQNQQSVGGQESTVQAQITAVMKSAPTPTP